MSLLFGSPQVGDHVRARRAIASGWMDALTGATSVPKGSTGIVREVRNGWFSSSLVVEFDGGWTTRTIRDVRPSDVSRTWMSGERAWQRRRDVGVGVRIGLFLVFGLPALVSLALYFLGGGTLAALIPALLEEGVRFALQVASVIGPLGVLLVVGGLYLRSKRR
ncbi:hypothetical protein DVA67_020370 [Solirubrobacter sp. CPCC 204708]|uniref:Uncharacterized protein n=1 Tax=Solirubrobacter deserti TaxID=2282478 RepID=A0ABT4RTT4_9ACTN|nr:hypothetical protein [Solirubrobacter deserti]MBE2318348.1 hypothetical protein [Solirubrobacter deserti]MDA0141946.1 hypothetical protein [Solirubrobacter deserti]